MIHTAQEHHIKYQSVRTYIYQICRIYWRAPFCWPKKDINKDSLGQLFAIFNWYFLLPCLL